MTNTMTDDRKALIERLTIAAANMAENERDHWARLMMDAIAALSAQPSPDAAQREPKCATCKGTKKVGSQCAQLCDSGCEDGCRKAAEACPDCTQPPDPRPAKDEAREVVNPYTLPIARTGEQQFACVLRNRSGVSAGEIDMGARFIHDLPDGDQQAAIEAAYSIYLKWCDETGKKSARHP